jgi:hypothetical protein
MPSLKKQRTLGSLTSPPDISKEREELKKWISAPLGSTNEKMQQGKIGGAPKISLKLQKIMLDADQSGTISAEEYAASEEQRKDTIDQVLSMLSTTGVVGALLISVLLPISLTPLTPSDESVAFFGDYAIGVIDTLFGVFQNTSLCLAFLTTYFSARKYMQLSVWMPTIDLKSWYLLIMPLAPISIMTQFCVLFAAVSLPLGVAIAISPARALLAFILVVLSSIIIFLEATVGGGDALLLGKLHEFATALLSSGAVDSKESPMRPGSGL